MARIKITVSPYFLLNSAKLGGDDCMLLNEKRLIKGFRRSRVMSLDLVTYERNQMISVRARLKTGLALFLPCNDLSYSKYSFFLDHSVTIFRFDSFNS